MEQGYCWSSEERAAPVSRKDQRSLKSILATATRAVDVAWRFPPIFCFDLVCHLDHVLDSLYPYCIKSMSFYRVLILFSDE